VNVRRLNRSYLTPDSIEAKAEKWRAALEPCLSERRRAEIPFRPEDSTLLVIDMQRFFLDKDSRAHLPAAEAVVPNIARLLAAYRRLSLPVYFTRFASDELGEPGLMARWWRDAPRADDPLAEIVPALKPRAGEEVLLKSKYSPFAESGFEDVLRARRVRSVVITGVMTHLCCESTARDAFMRDFEVFFVIDGTATRTEKLHMGSLRALADGFALPVTTEEVSAWLD